MTNTSFCWRPPLCVLSQAPSVVGKSREDVGPATVTTPEASHEIAPGSSPVFGLSPATEGQVLRLRIPELNQERRKELVKVAHKYAEAAKVAVRHVRRDGLDVVKKLEKNHEISEDDQERLANDVQKATDSVISEIDQLLAAKEKEILTV